MKEIPIFFTFDKYYVMPAAVAFHSLLKSADKTYMYRLHVLHTGLRVSDQKLLMQVVSRFKNATLSFLDTSDFPIAGKAQKGKAHFSKEIFYKLIAAKVFPQYDRIICSDVDVIFQGDIAPSYFMYENEFFYYAGVGQIVQSRRMESYKEEFTLNEQEVLEQEIAAGYLLMNLKAIRENGMQKRLTDFYLNNYHRLKLPEQDCLILCCWPHVRQLPMEYVVCNSYYRMDTASIAFNAKNASLPKERKSMLNLFEQALSHPIQLHYVGPYKPWNSFRCPRQRYWFAMLKEAGCVLRYVASIPMYAQQRSKRYSFRRFIRKMSQKVCKLIN